ncbi:MAG: phosphoribosylamine--glycine ligase [Bdellovibrionales bacterium]
MKLKVMVLGQGGREHALVKALAATAEVHAWPGNDGIALEATCTGGALVDHQGILQYVKEKKIDLVVVGPDQALADGVVDFLEEHSIPTFGPRKSSARLEWSKIFSKEFMTQAGLPTAKYQIVKSVKEVESALLNFTPPYVLKADGLALGKGVFICKTKEELLESAKAIFEQKTLGPAGESALLEQFSPGWELSLHILTNGKTFELFPGAQDHKRLKDHDEGPNTGGMGAVAPVQISPELMEQIQTRVLEPLMKHMQKIQMDYRGVLYLGLMITSEGPSLLEFNARFGDPEAQIFLPLLEGDWTEIFVQIVQGKVPKLHWKNKAAACVVLAAPGYPDNAQKGVSVQGSFKSLKNSYILHAGTKKQNDEWVTNGGRVLNAIGIGNTLEQALKNAYAQVQQISWKGLQYRKDIGQKVKGL